MTDTEHHTDAQAAHESKFLNTFSRSFFSLAQTSPSEYADFTVPRIPSMAAFFSKQSLAAWGAAGAVAYYLWVKPRRDEQRAVAIEVDGKRTTRG